MAAVQIQWPRLLRTAMVLFIVIASLRIITGDVPDGVVYTDLHQKARKGDGLVLKCEFFGSPYAVFWKKGHEGDDPYGSPTLITWSDVDPSSGPCVQNKSCEIGDDFSLIIHSIGITDQGRYFCVVSNHDGILIHNFTDVTVFASPVEPFPLINECSVMLKNGTDDVCNINIATSNHVSITCSATGYFPDIDLFFLHGSQQMETINNEVLINNDGSKNKSVSILAKASETPYVCIASDIPGSQAGRAVIVLVSRTATVTMSTAYNHTTSSPIAGVPKAVIPVIIFAILLSVVCVVIILWYLRKRRTTLAHFHHIRKADEEAVPLRPKPKIDGQLSFYEVWCLVTNLDESDLQKLRNAFINIGLEIREEDEGLTADQAYDIFCSWKDKNRDGKERNEGKILREKLHEYGIGDLWENVRERRWDTGTKASDELLEHIVRSIANEGKIALFLRKLIPDHHSIGDSATATQANDALVRWRDGDHKESHVILLSLALERAQCRPVDREFFKVPDHLMKTIPSQEVEGFVYKLTRRHCSRIGKAVGITDEKKIGTIIDENNRDLFDTQSMVSDWIAREECSNYEKRCKLDDAITKIGRHDMTDFFGTTVHRANNNGNTEKQHPHAKAFHTGSIFDDDLQSLLRYLPTDAIPLFLERLGISAEEDGRSIEEKLRDWRDKMLTESKPCSLKDLVNIHKEVLKKTNNTHVFDLNDNELEILAENIPSEQMEDLLSRLRIGYQQDQSPLQQLKEWRDNQDLEKRRQTFRKALHDMGLSGYIVDRRPKEHVYEVEMVRLGFSILCNDVGPLANLLGMDMNKGKTVQEPTKGTVGLLLHLLKKSKGLDTHHRRDFCGALKSLGYLDVARLTFFDYEPSLTELYDITSQLSQGEIGDLMDHLGKEKAVLSSWRKITGQFDQFTHMKMWRNQYRNHPFHYNFKLALGLRAIGRPAIVDNLLAGSYQATAVSSSVVINLLNNMENDHLKRLGVYLGLNVEGGQNDRTTLITNIVEWVGNWLKQFNNPPVLQATRTVDKFSFRRDKNDKLFRSGYFELAEEIMLLEYPRFPSA